MASNMLQWLEGGLFGLAVTACLPTSTRAEDDCDRAIIVYHLSIPFPGSPSPHPEPHRATDPAVLRQPSEFAAHSMVFATRVSGLPPPGAEHRLQYTETAPEPRLPSPRGSPPSCIFPSSSPPPRPQVLEIVKKTTGGKAWLPKWGLTGLTRTQKANRRKARVDEAAVRSALQEAAQKQPATANATSAGVH